MTTTTARPVQVLTRPEFQRLLDACGTTAGGMRNGALLCLLAGAGLRLAEGLALEIDDLDARGRVHVRRGKGAKARRVSLSPSFLAPVAAWLAERQRRALPGRLLVCSWSRGSEGAPMPHQHVGRLLVRLRQRAGLTKRVHAHGLRHSWAVWLVEAGADVDAVRQALGHTSLATTQIYLQGLNPERVHDAIARLG